VFAMKSAYGDSETPLRFGVFEIHPVSGQLRKKGLQVRLPRQAAELLVLLLQQPGQIRSRAELKQTLWPHRKFGDLDHGLNKAVYALRTALGDQAQSPRYIETLAGDGYRFIGEPHLAEGTHRAPHKPWWRTPVAVLPFSVAGGQAESEWIGGELALRVIDGLSRVHGLEVLAYSQSRTWRPEGTGWAPQPGLNVGSMIVGELRISSGHVSWHAEMVEYGRGLQIWGMHRQGALTRIDEVLETMSSEVVSRVEAAVQEERRAS
jgi:DNA-binding winged helix-turn-helix (wHTH) protein